MSWIRFFLGVCAAIVALALLGVWALRGFDTFGMGFHGILALLLGAILSSAVGIGLMALVFFSNRSGHDDEIGRPDPPDGLF